MNITILIKTFERPVACQRLIDSIKIFYPNIDILALDDSRKHTDFGVPQINEDFDIGISLGRNILVEKCQTEYCMILDDDCAFTEETDLAKAIRILETNDYDLLEIADRRGLNYRGKFDISGDTVKYITGDPLEFISNIFIAKTDILKKYKWDEDLKMGEHFAYFFLHRGKLKIGHTDEVRLDHIGDSNTFYNNYRLRATDYVKQFMKKQGIKERIDLGGNSLKI